MEDTVSSEKFQVNKSGQFLRLIVICVYVPRYENFLWQRLVQCKTDCEFATYWMLFTTYFAGTLNLQNARDFLILLTTTAQISVHHSLVLISATSDHMTCLICIQA